MDVSRKMAFVSSEPQEVRESSDRSDPLWCAVLSMFVSNIGIGGKVNCEIGKLSSELDKERFAK